MLAGSGLHFGLVFATFMVISAAMSLAEAICIGF